MVLGFVLLLAMGDSCSNGVVGVQDYGSVTGRVLDAMTNKPIPNAIVSVGSIFTATADSFGAFTMPRIPIGSQTVTARSPGFTTSSVDVRIHKDRAASAGYIRIVPLSKPDSVSTLPPPAPEPTAVPSALETWTPPSPSPEASAASPGPAPTVPASALPVPSATAAATATP